MQYTKSNYTTSRLISKRLRINFESLDNKIDTSTPMGMLLFNICAAFSEMERELIKERVQAGVNAAKTKGRKGGRPRSLTPEKTEKLHRLKKSGEFSVKQICEMVSISRSTQRREELNYLNIIYLANTRYMML